MRFISEFVLLSIVRKTFISNIIICKIKTLIQALQTVDVDGKKRIPANAFRRVISGFCFPLSDAQNRHLLSRIQKHINTEGVAYLDWLDEWADGAAGSTTARNSNAGSLLEDVERKVREGVLARGAALLQGLELADYANLGVVSLADFKKTIKDTAGLNLSESEVNTF